MPTRCSDSAPYEPGTARIEEAITIYHAILSDRVRISRQQQASIQHHLGTALYHVGARENDTERLREAVAIYAEVLTDETRKSLPFDWALNAGGQGVAYTLISERLSDARAAGTAIARISMALEVLRDGDRKGFPPYQIVGQVTASFEKQLQETRTLFDRPSRS